MRKTNKELEEIRDKLACRDIPKEQMPRLLYECILDQQEAVANTQRVIDHTTKSHEHLLRLIEYINMLGNG